MDSIALGKRIKEARLSKKMTQSEVVGNFITRNMLSQIESGTATPSVKTLEYLCSVLDIPADQLVGEPAEDAFSQLFQAKRLLSAGEYTLLVKMDGHYPRELSDEFYAILSQAYFKLAKQHAGNGEDREAADMIKKSIEYAGQGIYANPGLKAEGHLLLNEVAERLSKYYLSISAGSVSPEYAPDASGRKQP